MVFTSSNIEQWRRLYDCALQIKQISPWKTFKETDIFGVQDPQSNLIGFVSVMGALGEHYALAAYLGAEGIQGFWDLQNPDSQFPPEHFFEIEQLQVAFENRNELDKQDKDICKELGIKCHGKYAWPMFRSYQPAFVPWFLEEREITFMGHILEQSLTVFENINNDPGLIKTSDRNTYFVRVPTKQDDRIVWKDNFITVAPPEPLKIPTRFDDEIEKGLRQLCKEHYCFEIDFFMLPTHTREEEERPFYPYLLLIVDHQSGLIVSSEIVKPQPSLKEMWTSITSRVAQAFIKVGFIPEEIYIRRGFLTQMTNPLLKRLSIRFSEEKVLDRIDAVKNSLIDTFR